MPELALLLCYVFVCKLVYMYIQFKTILLGCNLYYLHMFFKIDFSDGTRRFISISTVLLVILSCFNLVLEGLHALNRKLEYFTDIRSYLDVFVAVLTIAFIISVRTNDCFCSSGGEWQLGCVVIFLAWVAFILLLRGFPFTAIAINMLLSITESFLKVLALPILLIVAFGLPLFLLLHIPVSDMLF